MQQSDTLSSQKIAEYEVRALHELKSEWNGSYLAPQTTWQRYTSRHGIHGSTLKKAFFYGYFRALSWIPWPSYLALGLSKRHSGLNVHVGWPAVANQFSNRELAAVYSGHESGQNTCSAVIPKAKSIASWQQS